MSIEHIGDSFDGNRSEEDPMREKLRKDNIERAARDFAFGPNAGDVEYIRQIRRQIEDGTASYDLTALLWRLSGIAPEQEHTFEKFKPRKGYPTVKQAYDAAIGWSLGKSPPFLTLAGPPGTGKTHLALAATQAIVARGGMVMYLRVKDLLESYKKQRYGLRSGEGMDSDLKGVPYLALDDLGMERSTDWTSDFLDDLVDFRYANRRRTIVCTNQKGEELPARIADRLSDARLGRVVQIDAPSYRQHRQ